MRLFLKSGTAMASSATVINGPCALSRIPLERFSGDATSATKMLRRLELGAGGCQGPHQRRGGGSHPIKRVEILAHDNRHVLGVEAGKDVVLVGWVRGKLPAQAQVQ